MGHYSGQGEHHHQRHLLTVSGTNLYANVQVHVARFLAVAIGGGAVAVVTAVVHFTWITSFSRNLPTVRFLQKVLLLTPQVRILSELLKSFSWSK